MRLYLYITAINSYVSGNISFHASDHEISIKGWMLTGTVEFEPKINEKELLDLAIENLTAEESELRADFQTQLDEIQEQKQKLLSIPHLSVDQDTV